MGGSDQWGNIVNGIDLGRRMGTPQLYALTCPLLTTASGAKMGKTAAGAVWLNADMLSPYDYWQFWRNTEDADVERFLKLFTDAAARRDRPARGAGRRRDQRGQEAPGHRGDGPAAWPREAAARPRNGAQDLRGRHACRKPADASSVAGLAEGVGVLTAFVRGRASCPRPARRAARSRAAGSGSTTSSVSDERARLGAGRPDRGGRGQAVARRKRHVLARPA